MLLETPQVQQRALCAQTYRRTDGRRWPFGWVREYPRSKRTPGAALKPTARWSGRRGVVIAGARRCLALYVMDHRR